MTPTMISATEAYYKTQIEEHFPNIPFAFSGEDNPDTTLYCRFWVIPSEKVIPIGFGTTAKSRNVGVIQIDVLGKKDQGAGETGDLVWPMVQWFKRLQKSAGSEGVITFKEPAVKDWGTVGEQHRQTGTVPYYYDFT